MRSLLLVLLAISLTACQSLRARFHRHDKKDPNERVPPGATIMGNIEMVNPDSQFVIVRLGSTVAMTEGTELVSVGEDGKQAKLKVTPEHKGVLLTADIIEGEPHRGDPVVRTAEAAVAAAAAALKAAQAAEAQQAAALPPIDSTEGQRPTISISPGNSTAPAPTAPPSGEFLRIVPPAAPPR